MCIFSDLLQYPIHLILEYLQHNSMQFTSMKTLKLHQLDRHV